MKAAVLGSPIAHSLSPVLHRAAYRELGLDGWTYEALECDEAGLPGLVAGLGPEWAGLSLTMPLKRAVLPLLDQSDPLVTQVGGANTMVLSGGRKHGYNTDVPGMVTALTEGGVSLAGPVLVLGGGATAASAVVALQRAGAAVVTLAVRNPAAVQPVLEVAARASMPVEVIPFGPSGVQRGTRWDLLLSTVPAGAADAYADSIAAGAVPAAAVFDVVYHPWPTRLATAAAGAGLPVIGGFELLLQQAAEQVRLMTGRPAPVDAMRSAGLAALVARSGQ